MKEILFGYDNKVIVRYGKESNNYDSIFVNTYATVFFTAQVQQNTKLDFALILTGFLMVQLILTQPQLFLHAISY
jgi:hypothetical protein